MISTGVSYGDPHRTLTFNYPPSKERGFYGLKASSIIWQKRSQRVNPGKKGLGTTVILSDHELVQWAENGGVSPFDSDNINPASINLTLGNTISVPRWYWRLGPIFSFLAFFTLGQPDPRKTPELFWSTKVEFSRHILWPRRFVLAHSLETTQILPDLAAALFSTSTTGRTGLEHAHAGWGDPGFGYGNPSQWTWELFNLAPWPIILVPGQRLMQLVLMGMRTTPVKDYRMTGRYQGQRGPTPPRGLSV